MVSDKLCLALSLQDGGIPLFISRMKEHGYPPGWKILREEILKMFDENGEGKRVCVCVHALIKLNIHMY